MPQDGQPIILFVDQQTTGGYPKIANVIAADMHRVGQLRPRDTVRFVEVSIPEAVEILAPPGALADGDDLFPDRGVRRGIGSKCRRFHVDINADLGESEEIARERERLRTDALYHVRQYRMRWTRGQRTDHARDALGSARAEGRRRSASGLSRSRELRTAGVTAFSGGHRGFCAAADRGTGEDCSTSLDVQLVHVKPHGALYHAANTRREVALAIGRAVMAIDSGLILVGQAGSPALDVWRAMGLHAAAEGFADRSYEPDGTLRKRTLAGALLSDPARAAQQAVDLALRHRAVASDGSELTVDGDTICIHSDTPGSVSIAREVNRALKAAGVLVQCLSWEELYKLQPIPSSEAKKSPA